MYMGQERRKNVFEKHAPKKIPHMFSLSSKINIMINYGIYLANNILSNTAVHTIYQCVVLINDRSVLT